MTATTSPAPLPDNLPPTSGQSGSLGVVSGSAVWDQYFCAALVGQLASQSLHDQPHVWQPYQAEISAKMADAMMVERSKRYP